MTNDRLNITSTEFKSELLTEARASLGLAAPLAFAQLAQTAIPVRFLCDWLGQNQYRTYR